ncbi:MAG TPA: alpha/beta fold hydrolase [Solirubrobacteraceae bacterium]|jgi:pimeloyl-ACP methyl ester carboxylesterase|nr:alpha/beta fold hydrolase [Solirubrobacteraceae bacterium]
METDVRARRRGYAEAAFRTLPDRYLGGEPGFHAVYRIKLADIGVTWEVTADHHGARVQPGCGHRRPDCVITTDSVTWLRLHRSEITGVQAFTNRQLTARGNLDLAMGFEGRFRRLDGGQPFARIYDVPVGRLRISTLTMGSGRDVILLHGLGATKASFVDTAAALSAHYRVHALDLPGFGSSSKPATAPYTPRWFAARVLDWMDEVGIRRAHLVGNSMGGHISIEIALEEPRRIGAVGLLCPALAFVRRELWPMVRLARPEFGVLPHRVHRALVAGQFWDMVADRDRVDPAIGDIAVDEFRRIYDSAGARYAFLSAARNIYLTPPFGRHGFYPRLAELSVPALFLWGTHDPLVPAAFARHVAQWLPRAEQIILENCGHIPQVERPEQTNGLLRRFFAHADALTDAPSPWADVDAA